MHFNEFHVIVMDTVRLVDLCCRRLSELLIFTDTLKGIPEHLGCAVFKYVADEYTKDVLDTVSMEIFSLFAEAYGSSFIHAFRLDRHSSHLSNWLQMLSMSKSLRYLYLDECQLGLNSVEYLPRIGQFDQLILLSLKHNFLCHDNIRSLTAHWRFSGKSNLRCLDLSGKCQWIWYYCQVTAI